MRNIKIDFFAPWIMALAIIVFLIMGYIGSFNYRFEDPLDLEVILTIILATIVFLAGAGAVRYFIKPKKEIRDINIPVKYILTAVLIAIILQALNLVLMGGIPLLNDVLRSNATTNLWRIAYPLFLIAINLLFVKEYKKRYLILVAIGVLLFGLNGYRTSVMGILISVFITLYYTNKINRKIGILFICAIAVGLVAIGFIATQSIANQHWMLNPVELIFYRAGFTLEVFERIIPLGATTDGHVLSMIFSSGSPRTFIGQYVLSDNVCLTSTLFGPVYLDFGMIGLLIQMFIIGVILKLLHNYKKGVGIAFYSIILTHTLIWIETGPTDIMIWFLYLIGILFIVFNHFKIKESK